MLNVNLPNSSVGGGKTTKSQVIEALGYTPAGGENLVANSSETTEITANETNDYMFQKFVLTKKLVKNEKYTVSFDVEILKGELNSLTVSIQNQSINAAQSDLTTANIVDGKATTTLVVTGDSSYYLLIYAGMFQHTRGNSIRVSRIILQEGIVTDPVWTPAPEDVVVRPELEELIKRVAALEAKVGITSADSMELPSMDVMESGSEIASADAAARVAVLEGESV